MNLTPTNNRRRGFTLVEMIGVLAVIAVLAGLLIPRVFSAISQSRINSTALGYNSLKSAALLYFGKYGKFADTNGVASGSHSASWDDGVLLPEGFVEKPFETQLATSTTVALVAASNAAAALTGTTAGTYALDGGTANTAIGTSVIEAVLAEVSAEDARELNDRIDGASLAGTVAGTDQVGRVKYTGITAGTVGTVRLYIAHK